MSARFFINVYGQLLIAASLGFGWTVLAQEPPAPPEAGAPVPNSSATTPAGKKGDKKQTLSFEDELVEGSTQKPELFYLFQKKNFNYKRLIRLRENFLPEMRKTS